MMKRISHKFVKNIPEDLAEGVLYISMEYSTAIHNCCCGCGGRVVTPLSPAAWSLAYDGETVSLFPSIGNWSFKCKSHYWIANNKVEWAREWDKEEIEYGRENDKRDAERHYKKKKHKSWYELW